MERPVTTQSLSSDLDTMRDKFNRELRERDYYPSTPSPGDCYIFDVVLGIDPRLLPVNQVVSPKTYKTTVLDSAGKPERSEGEVILVTRKFTAEQRKALKEWWPLLSPRIRGFADDWI